MPLTRSSSSRFGELVAWLILTALGLFAFARLLLLVLRRSANSGAAGVQTIFQEPAFLHSLGFAAIAALVIAAITTIVAGFAGYALSRSSARRSQSEESLPLLSALFGLTILLLPYYFGSVWSSALTAETGQMVIYAFAALPFCIWRVKIAAGAISPAMLDAARLEGCSSVQRFGLLVLPLLTRALIVSAIFSFALAWNVGSLHNLPFHPATEVEAAMLLLSMPLVLMFVWVSRKNHGSETPTHA